MIQSQPSYNTYQNVTCTPKKVVIQGYKGAFHDMAAQMYYQQEDIEIVPADTFEDLVAWIERGEKANVGLMAIENTVAGSLMYNYDLLRNSELQIIGEVYLRIKQNLMTLPNVKIEDLKEVHSHYMALRQCSAFLKQYPHLKLVETIDTALSAKEIKENQLTNVGAIGSTLAAEIYGLEIIGESIETNKKNFTRFLVLQSKNQQNLPETVDKVSLCFSINHEVGSLYKVLAVLAAYNVNLTKIQSTPIIGKPWEYQFFVDFAVEGKVSYEQALSAIVPITSDLKVMGAYAKGLHHEY
jgi:prephenate dehydratase